MQTEIDLGIRLLSLSFGY